MSETRFTEFPALSIDPTVRFSRFASMTLKIIFYHSHFFFFVFDSLRCITTFSNCHSMFFVLVTFNVACELSQPKGNRYRIFDFQCKIDFYFTA